MDIQEYIPILTRYFEVNLQNQNDILYDMFDGCHCDLKAIADDILLRYEPSTQKIVRTRAFALGLSVLYIREHKDSDFKLLGKKIDNYVNDIMNRFAARNSYRNTVKMPPAGILIMNLFDEGSCHYSIHGCDFILSTDKEESKKQIQQIQLDYDDYWRKFQSLMKRNMNELSADEKIYFNTNKYHFSGWLVLNNRIESLKLLCPYQEMFCMHSTLHGYYNVWSLMMVALSSRFTSDTFEAFKILYSKGIRLVSSSTQDDIEENLLDDCDGCIPYWIIKKKHVRMLDWYIHERKTQDPSYPLKLVETLQYKYLDLALSDSNPCPQLVEYLQAMLS